MEHLPGELDRYDMTGKDLTKWREGRVREYLAKVKALFTKVRAHKVEGDEQTLEQHARSIPKKVIDLGDATLTKLDTERQLSQAKTEQAFAEAELARIEAERVQKETAERERVEALERRAREHKDNF
ncbi:MAG: hypothetical protein AAFV77_12290, partial [Planctomycetota bacterium]